MDDLKLYSKSENELKALVNTVDIFSKDIGMKFGISKCVKVIVHRGKYEPVGIIAEGIMTRTGCTTHVEGDKGYKYLEIRQADENMQEKIKDETKQAYSK